MARINTDGLKIALEKEKSELENQIKDIASINPSNPLDWEPKAPELNNSGADRNEVADRIEGFETNKAIEEQLEIRIQEIREALTKIEEGKYGSCDVCKGEIEEDRLGANPAAKTCKTHM